MTNGKRTKISFVTFFCGQRKNDYVIWHSVIQSPLCGQPSDNRLGRQMEVNCVMAITLHTIQLYYLHLIKKHYPQSRCKYYQKSKKKNYNLEMKEMVWN